MGEDTQSYGVRLSTSDLAKKLTGIYERNMKIPPRKREKESIPEFTAPNVTAKTLVERDFKKNTMSYIRRYKNIGLVDGCGGGPQGGAPFGSAETFSIHKKTRELQTRQNKQRINHLRKHYGDLIGTKDSKEEKAHTPLTGPQLGLQSANSAMSLSVYNTRLRATGRRRPRKLTVLA